MTCVSKKATPCVAALVVAVFLMLTALLWVLSGCSSASTDDQSTDSLANSAKTATQDMQSTNQETCYVVSNVKITDLAGKEIAEIAYTLDDRGGTDKVVSTSSEDDGKAVWNYTLNEEGLPEKVDFTFTSSEGDDAYQTEYEYGGVEDGLPASESSTAQYIEEDGTVEYEYIYDYEYEDGFIKRSKYRIFEDGKEITTQSKSQTYDPVSGVLQKYESNYVTVNFKGKKNSDGQIQTVDFTIAGQSYRVDCTYNENGTIAALKVTVRGAGDGFAIVPEYIEITDPYPLVRANSKSFIWNGLVAELGL